MAGIRLSLAITIGIIVDARVSRRARRSIGVGRELDSMLAEGQGGFTDMMRARWRGNALRRARSVSTATSASVPSPTRRVTPENPTPGVT